MAKRGNQKDRQFNGQKKNNKKRSNDLQNTTQKTKHCVIATSQKKRKR